MKYKLSVISSNNAIMSICNSLVQKNYLFTKVVQWGVQEVYNGANIKDNDELKLYFSVFSNNVPYTQDELYSALSCIQNITEFAKARNDKLVVESNIPTNSGSVALIFKALLNDAPVIIKVLRPNIKTRIEHDIDAVLFFFNNIFIKNIVRYYIKIDFKKFIESNSESLLNQCDFMSEVNNALLFKDNLKNNKSIVIPDVYKHFTDKYNDVIVMEYLDGPIAKNVSLDLLRDRCEIFQSFFFESLFRYNILHGDFHLGNIIITNNNTIGIIDFGIVYNLSDSNSDQLFNLLFLSFRPEKMKQLIRAIIRYLCIDKNYHDMIYNKIINDKEITDMFSSDFSANFIIKLVNKLMSQETLEIKKDLCKLLLSAMSGLQTIDYINEDKSLEYLVKSYINRSIPMD